MHALRSALFALCLGAIALSGCASKSKPASTTPTQATTPEPEAGDDEKNADAPEVEGFRKPGMDPCSPDSGW